MKERNILILLVGLFLAFYFMPSGTETFDNAIIGGFSLLHDYAQQHILTCLVPAFFIAGAINVFIKKDEVLKYLGQNSKRHLSYSIASVAGIILAVCSCTILPLFAGIRKRGAGLGPATTFLFSGPAINIAAIFLTMSILGYPIGLARITSAIIISILVGISMELLFREKAEGGGIILQKSKDKSISRNLIFLFFGSMVGVLVVNGLQMEMSMKYLGMLALALVAGLVAYLKFPKETTKEWLWETWTFTKTLTPYLFIGVFVAGFVMPYLPQSTIESLVGENTVQANFVASVFGAFMYFSTLTEIPILQAFIAKGMASGPALALLLAGPSLSLPNMLVIRRVMGNKKTAAYVGLIIIYSTIAGLIAGNLIG